MGTVGETLDRTLDDAGFLRLSTARPCVRHIGNRIVEPGLAAEFERLLGEPATPVVGSKSRAHWLWGRVGVRRMLRYVYQWAFKKYARQPERG